MRIHRRFVGAGLVALFALLVPVLVASPASADNVVFLPPNGYVTGYGGDVVSNGTFATPAAPAGDFSNVVSGGTIGAWTVGGGGVDLNSSGYLPVQNGAPAGAQDVDLSGDLSSGTVEGTISQTMTTIPGQLYTLGFFLAGNVYGGPAVKTGTVSIGGDVHSYSFDTTGHTDASAAAMGWTHESYTFTATSASTPVVFASTTNSAYGPLISGVQFSPLAQTEIPIPTIAPGATGTLHLNIATSENWESDTNLPSGVTFVNANGATLVSPTEVKAGPFLSAPYPDHLDLSVQVSPSATPGSLLTATVPSTVTSADGTVATIHIIVQVGSNNAVPVVNPGVAGGLAGIVVVILGGVYLIRRRRTAAARAA